MTFNRDVLSYTDNLDSYLRLKFSASSKTIHFPFPKYLFAKRNKVRMTTSSGLRPHATFAAIKTINLGEPHAWHPTALIGGSDARSQVDATANITGCATEYPSRVSIRHVLAVTPSPSCTQKHCPLICSHPRAYSQSLCLGMAQMSTSISTVYRPPPNLSCQNLLCRMLYCLILHGDSKILRTASSLASTDQQQSPRLYSERAYHIEQLLVADTLHRFRIATDTHLETWLLLPNIVIRLLQRTDSLEDFFTIHRSFGHSLLCPHPSVG